LPLIKNDPEGELSKGVGGIYANPVEKKNVSKTEKKKEKEASMSLRKQFPEPFLFFRASCASITPWPLY